MSQFPAGSVALGVGACSLAILIGTFLVLSPNRTVLPQERRRPGSKPAKTAPTRAATAAILLIDKALGRGGGASSAALLQRAGVRMRLQEFVLLVITGALATAAVGIVVAGPVGACLGLLIPVTARLGLTRMVGRRQHAFADQLDDSLQLMASSLRAGHSLQQALDSVSREAEDPTAGEFSRITNEIRVGRDLGSALKETSDRMNSDDFRWVTQAIAINREVGGNLAEVLDGVGHTIRERNQIRRQVKALSAEGKLSAIVLMALPFGIVAFLALANPGYLAKFTQSPAGYAMIGMAVILLIVGALWLRKVVSFKF